MEIVNRNGRNVYKTLCKECSRDIFIERSRLHLSSGVCTRCHTASRNRANKGKYKHSRNEYYFAEKSLQSIYWAGFIAADGCISDGNTVSIKIKETDIDRLEQFIKDTNYAGDILKSGDENRKRVVVRSHQWSSDLRRLYNISQRKSLILSPPNDLSIDEALVYLIGYIDGDGTICYIGSDKYLKLGMVGSLEFVLWAKEIFDTIDPPQRQAKSITFKGSVYEYVVYGKRAQRIINRLRNIPVNKMERKWK